MKWGPPFKERERSRFSPLRADPFEKGEKENSRVASSENIFFHFN